jgi:hypothetical protein
MNKAVEKKNIDVVLIWVKACIIALIVMVARFRLDTLPYRRFIDISIGWNPRGLGH